MAIVDTLDTTDDVAEHALRNLALQTGPARQRPRCASQVVNMPSVVQTCAPKGSRVTAAKDYRADFRYPEYQAKLFWIGQRIALRAPWQTGDLFIRKALAPWHGKTIPAGLSMGYQQGK